MARILLIVMVVSVVGGASCRREQPTAPEPSAETQAVVAGRFTEITTQVGLDFVHNTGQQGGYWMPEAMGGGAAVFDYDNDGDLDIYIPNAGSHESDTAKAGSYPNRLFRQEPDGRFKDVTEGSGLGHTGYAMGCAVGDIDNDGDLDIYVTNFGTDVLFRNNGDGSFTDISTEAGIGGERWSCSASFLDYDRDGFLDLYVTSYVNYTPPKSCSDFVGRTDYCGPEGFAGVPDVLYHNEGGKRFQDVSSQTGIASADYAGLGLYCADFNEDGWIDVYVANDADPNNLWINQQGQRFNDEGVLRGAAFNRNGQTEAGMGVTAGDADGDGDFDLFVTHLIEESNTYYRNAGRGAFEDATSAVKLTIASLKFTAFGTAFFDYDNDLDLDLAVVNGAVKRRPQALRDGDSFWREYAEPNHLFENNGHGIFDEVGETAGAFGTHIEVSRSLIPADFDSDGDLDLLVINLDAPARIFRNDQEGGSWLQVRAFDPDSKRDAYGSRVAVRTVEGGRLVRDINPAFSYLSSGDARAHFGLGSQSNVAGITVYWLDGLIEKFPLTQVNQDVVLRKGSGEPAP